MKLLKTIITIINFKSFLFLISVVIIGICSYAYYLKGELKETKRELNNEKAFNTQVALMFTDTVAAYQRLAFEYKNIEKNMQSIEEEFGFLSKNKIENFKKLKTRLLKTIKDKDSKIVSLSSAILDLGEYKISDSTKTYQIEQLRDSLGNIYASRDSVYIDDGVVDNIGLQGFVVTNPAFYSFKTWIDPIGMQVYITKDKKGSYDSYLILSNSKTKIPIMNTYVKTVGEIDRTWKDNLFLKPITNIGVAIGYEYELFPDFVHKDLYIKTTFPLWKFKQHVLIKQNALRFQTEFNIFGR